MNTTFIAHYNVKGSQWGVHKTGDWDKRATYANGQPNPDARRTRHAYAQAKKRSTEAEQHLRIARNDKRESRFPLTVGSVGAAITLFGGIITGDIPIAIAGGTALFTAAGLRASEHVMEHNAKKKLDDAEEALRLANIDLLETLKDSVTKVDPNSQSMPISKVIEPESFDNLELRSEIIQDELTRQLNDFQKKSGITIDKPHKEFLTSCNGAEYDAVKFLSILEINDYMNYYGFRDSQSIPAGFYPFVAFANDDIPSFLCRDSKGNIGYLPPDGDSSGFVKLNSSNKKAIDGLMYDLTVAGMEEVPNYKDYADRDRNKVARSEYDNAKRQSSDDYDGDYGVTSYDSPSGKRKTK